MKMFSFDRSPLDAFAPFLFPLAIFALLALAMCGCGGIPELTARIEDPPIIKEEDGIAEVEEIPEEAKPSNPVKVTTYDEPAEVVAIDLDGDKGMATITVGTTTYETILPPRGEKKAIRIDPDIAGVEGYEEWVTGTPTPVKGAKKKRLGFFQKLFLTAIIVAILYLVATIILKRNSTDGLIKRLLHLSILERTQKKD